MEKVTESFAIFSQQSKKSKVKVVKIIIKVEKINCIKSQNIFNKYDKL